MPTVIVVDDEPIVRKDLCLILEKAGYHVVAQASDGLRRLRHAGNTIPWRSSWI